MALNTHLENISATTQSPSAGTPDLTAQMETILLTKPLSLLDLHKQNRFRSFGDKSLLEKIDLRYLCLATMEYIMGHMALSEGLSEPEILAHLGILIREQASDIWEDDLKYLTQGVFSALRNDDSGKFQHTYWNGTTTVSFDFNLIVGHEARDASVKFKLSDEAINLLVRALKFDRATQQEILEMLLDSAIVSGQFKEAVTFARASRDNSIGYGDRIVTLLNQARRRIGSVSWTGDIEKIISDAQTHISKTIARERRLGDLVTRKRADIGESDTLIVELDRLIALIHSCEQIHNALERTIRQASADWRDQQLLAFRPKHAQRLADLDEQLFPAILAMPVATLADSVDGILTSFLPPLAHPIFDFGQIMQILCLPKIERQEAVAFEESAITYNDALLPHFPEGMAEQAKLWIRRQVSTHKTMSGLLAAAKADGKEEIFQEIVFYLLEMAIQADTIPELAEKPEILGNKFNAGFVRGDDVSFSLKA